MAVGGKTIIDEVKLTNIANAIRAKAGTTSLLSPAEMVSAINALSGEVQPFEWSWTNAVENITISAQYAGDYETYGDNLLYLCLGTQTIVLTNIESHDNLIGWCEYLADGGHASVLVKSGLLSDAEKTELTNKGYNVVES